jgi:hypothetical protein
VNNWPAAALCEEDTTARERGRRRRGRGDAERKHTPRKHNKDPTRKMHESIVAVQLERVLAVLAVLNTAVGLSRILLVPRAEFL